MKEQAKIMIYTKIIGTILGILIYNDTLCQSKLNVTNLKIFHSGFEFELINENQDIYSFEDFHYRFEENKYTPQFYTQYGDTLRIEFFRRTKQLQTSHPIEDTVIIDGKKRSHSLQLFPNDKMTIHVHVLEEEEKKIKTIELKFKEDTIYLQVN